MNPTSTVILHPSYFPNCEQFAFIAQQNICWEVWDNYQKQTYRNRCYICTDQGKHMLNVPIKHVGAAQGRQRYKDVLLDDTYPWQRQHWRTLETAYRTSPFFEFFEDDLAPLFEKKFTFLLDFNLHAIAFLCESLQLDMPTEKTTAYAKTYTDKTDARFLVNAKTRVEKKQEPYTQVFVSKHGFVAHTSVLDLLFNEGTNALSYLERYPLAIPDA